MTIQQAIQESEFKIIWAKVHAANLQRIIGDAIKPTGDLIRSEQEPQTRHYIIRVGPRDGFPIELPLHLGDAIHALNGCLDYLWTGLGRSAGLVANKRISFPRHEERENLAQSVTQSAIQQAFPQAEDFILKKVRPYKAGNFPLWAIGRLDNISKHRFLLLTPTIHKYGRFIATSADGSVINLSGSKVQSYGNTLDLGFTSPVKLDYDAETTVEVVFTEDQLFTGQPVLATLLNLIETVAETRKLFIETFAP